MSYAQRNKWLVIFALLVMITYLFITTCAHVNLKWFMIILCLNQQEFSLWSCVLLTLHTSDELGRWFIPLSPVTIVLVDYEVFWILLHDIFWRVNLHGWAEGHFYDPGSGPTRGETYLPLSMSMETPTLEPPPPVAEQLEIIQYRGV